MEAKEKFEALEKLGAQFNATLMGFAKENGFENGKVDKSSLETDKLEKIKTDIMARMDVLNPPKKKMIFDPKAELKENEERVNLAQYMLMCKYNDPAVRPNYMKTVMSEGDNAQGGYTVPTGQDSVIIGELNEATSIIPKCTAYNHSQADGHTKNIPKWLTDLTIYWVAEAALKTSSKPTLAQKQSILKKVCALVTYSDEYLQDDISGISALVAKLVGENMAYELERIILVGDVTGAGDPFNGIYNSVGISTVNQSGVSLAYSDIVGTWMNPNVNSKLQRKCEWYLNKTSLALVMNLVDANGRPLWNLGALSAGVPPNILGDAYNISQAISNTLGANSNASTIIYGDYKYILLGQKAGNSGIQIKVSQDGVISNGSGVVTENLLQQDETAYRFVMRRGVLVAVPEAYSVLKEVK